MSPRDETCHGAWTQKAVECVILLYLEVSLSIDHLQSRL